MDDIKALQILQDSSKEVITAVGVLKIYPIRPFGDNGHCIFSVLKNITNRLLVEKDNLKKVDLSSMDSASVEFLKQKEDSDFYKFVTEVVAECFHPAHPLSADMLGSFVHLTKEPPERLKELNLADLVAISLTAMELNIDFFMKAMPALKQATKALPIK